ncbi:MAG: DUF7948 domain-containing protein [Candidatus Aquicultorales bacterium]
MIAQPKPRVTHVQLALLFTILTLGLAATGRISSSGGPPVHIPPPKAEATAAKASDVLGKMPIYFTANEGQVAGGAKYYALGSGYTFYLAEGEVTYAFTRGEREGYALKLTFPGSDPDAVLKGAQAQSAKVNYLTGGDPQAWKTNIPTFAQVKYESLYPGIDLFYKGDAKTVKYEYAVAPGADYRAIKMAYAGADSLSLDKQGNLLIATPWGSLKDEKPVAYQMVGGKKTKVTAAFAVDGNAVGFTLRDYNPKYPLVIDPALRYSTFLGGAVDDNGKSIAVDAQGFAYVTGYTQSSNYPPVAGSYDTSANGSGDTFITKVNPTAWGPLVYSTYLGGTGDDEGHGIAVDGSGRAYVTGKTADTGSPSTNFPFTTGAYDTVHNGDYDTFVTILNSAGNALDYSTFLGSTGYDEGNDIAVGPTGTANIAGQTADTGSAQTNMPVTANAVQPSHNVGPDAFIAKIRPTGGGQSDLRHSTFLGGDGCDAANGIVVDGSGIVYVTGYTDAQGPNTYPVKQGSYDTSHNGADDVFVSKIDPTLSPGSATLLYSTFLGGNGHEAGNGIAIDTSGKVYVTGYTVDTFSPATYYPTTNGAYDTQHNGQEDAVVSKLDPNTATPVAQQLVYSTFLGGAGRDEGKGIAVDGYGIAYVTGLTSTASVTFPVYWFPVSNQHRGPDDVFLTEFRSGGNGLVYSTLLGGTGTDQGNGIAIGPGRSPYITGFTQSEDGPAVSYPTTTGAFQTISQGQLDAFATKFVPDAIPGRGVVGVATFSICDLGNGGGFRFANATSPGEAWAEHAAPEHAAPAGYTLIADGYFDVGTTAGYTGDIDVTLPYVYAGDESQLSIFHWEGGAWVNRTYSRDPANDVITARVSSLSPFMIGAPSGGGSSSVPSSSVYSLFGTGLLSLGALAVTFRKRRTSVEK